MLKTFVIFSQDKTEAVKLHSKLLGGGDCNVQIIESLVAVYERAAQGGVDCFVLDLKELDANCLHIVRNVRAGNPHLPVIILATKAQKEIMVSLKETKSIVVMEKPYRYGEFLKIKDKVMTGEVIYHREHKRYSIDVPIALGHLESAKKWSGRMYNVSKGGAYIEVKDGSFMSGDILELDISWGNQETQSSKFQVEVVWANKVKSTDSTVSAGFKFVKPESVNISFL